MDLINTFTRPVMEYMQKKKDILRMREQRRKHKWVVPKSSPLHSKFPLLLVSPVTNNFSYLHIAFVNICRRRTPLTKIFTNRETSLSNFTRVAIKENISTHWWNIVEDDRARFGFLTHFFVASLCRSLCEDTETRFVPQDSKKSKSLFMCETWSLW